MKRYLWSMSLIGLALLALVQFLYAEDWICKGGDVDCLRNAIKEANGNGEANTVTLGAGHYDLPMADPTAEGQGSGLSVTGTIDIIGAGDENTVLKRTATAPPFRLVEVGPTGKLKVEGVTFRGGASLSLGGGLRIKGELQLGNSTVETNTADDGGGGLAIVDNGKAILWGTTVARNTAEGPGPDCLGSIISLGNNLIGDPTDCTLTLRGDDLTWAHGYGADLRSQPSGTGGLAVASPRFAFAASKASGKIFEFAINASGRLSPNGSVAACNGPVGLATDHTRQWLYVACGDKPFEVLVFGIDTAGHLARQQTVPVSGVPSGIEVAPNNLNIYVTKSLALPGVGGPDQVSFTLQRYTRNPLNGLLAFAEEQRTQGADPDVVALTPQGDLAFVGNASGNDVMTFRIEPFSGRMTAAVGLTRTGRTPTALRVTPQGDLLMVGCERDGVYVYAIDHSSGRLTQVDHRGSFAAGLGVSPDGSSLIVTWWDKSPDRTVTAYTIDHTAQKLVLRQTVVDTGGEPSTYNGSVRFNDGGSFYVVNIHDKTGYQAGNVQRYTMDGTGKVTAQEYVSAGLQPAALAIAK